MPKRQTPGRAGGFVDEMRAVAMKLHTRDQAKEGEKEPDSPPVSKWAPSIDGYLRFLVDNKLVYDTLETIVQKAAYPCYAEFRNTGLERSENLVQDLEWFKDQGHTIPEPSVGASYARYLEELSEKDPQAFICHFYNIYFAHSAGGRMIGRKVAEKILDNKELQFYKWDTDLSQLLQNVRDKLNRVATSCLVASDPTHHIQTIPSSRQELTRACLEKGTELIQPIAHSLFALPSSDDPDGPIVLLPQPTTKLPREKQLPKRKPPTKWELFAKIKD
ncbi:hypothetical protein OPV22_032775 [Ensete ventricosum]|uniref:Ribosome biogenesis regulatory protein n=1 Tax=Ensete ventricosum TaxID=4639 RepID=A0AAV8PLD7_ENSVE|nr:hypothetical protein OPV22_032775 [Ensete ventricosum]